MLYTELTRLALRIAYDAHQGQTDKMGLPYIHHPLYLAEVIGDDEVLIATALLHDVVEDTNITLEDLTSEGIPKEVVAALQLLTHEDDVPYMDYILRIKESGNEAAIAVKLSDLRHNSNTQRLAPMDSVAKARIGRYQKAIELLESNH
jgi:(p)ppGpp synthase/HD superfamily hydrolase